jgi:DNA-directed RNA polymerase specialized sigma24 family protein
MATSPDDFKWLQQLRAGDEEAWAGAEKSFRRIFQTFLTPPPRAVREDLVANALEMLYETVETLGERKATPPTLHSIALRAAHRMSRELKSRASLSPIEAHGETTAPEDLDRLTLEDVLGALHSTELKLLAFIVDPHHSPETISRALDIAVGTFWNRRSALERKLRKCLELKPSKPRRKKRKEKKRKERNRGITLWFEITAQLLPRTATLLGTDGHGHCRTD